MLISLDCVQAGELGDFGSSVCCPNTCADYIEQSTDFTMEPSSPVRFECKYLSMYYLADKWNFVGRAGGIFDYRMLPITITGLEDNRKDGNISFGWHHVDNVFTGNSEVYGISEDRVEGTYEIYRRHYDSSTDCSTALDSETNYTKSSQPYVLTGESSIGVPVLSTPDLNSPFLYNLPAGLGFTTVDSFKDGWFHRTFPLNLVLPHEALITSAPLSAA